ncbi:MAG: acyltransferase [Bacteroidota bacterium]
MNRLFTLDYLRGIAAFGIMIYHYLSWSVGKFGAENIIGRIGIYGVSIFYVLSGLTLYHVYFSKMQFNKNDILLFFRKRILRIFPLLWLVSITTVLLSSVTVDFNKLFLNLSGLFGLVAWDNYLAVGAWSIGNELVFYLFFPFFLFFIRKSKWFIILISIVFFVIYLYFSFNVLSDNNTLNAQWRDYINPLNQVFLFLCGLIIGHLFKIKEFKPLYSYLIILLGLAIFILCPVSGNAIHLVTGYNRLFFTLSCLLICLGSYKLSIKPPLKIHKALSILGEASYSVYLLHPIVYLLVSRFFSLIKFDFHIPSTAVTLIFSVLFTLCLSVLVYEYFEKYFMKLGGKKYKTTVRQTQS